MGAVLTDDDVEAALRDGALICQKCGTHKPLGEFTPSRRNRLGVRATCRRCNANRVAGQRAMDPEHVRRRDRARIRPMDHRAKQATWRAANRERSNATMREATRRRRARMAGGDVRLVTQRDLYRLAQRQRGRCAYCGACAQLTVDHLVAVALGGRHAIGNLVLACFLCNRRKGTLLPIQFKHGGRCRVATTTI